VDAKLLDARDIETLLFDFDLIERCV
jgi:hypothetical protein